MGRPEGRVTTIPTFTPPVVNSVPAVLPETRGVQRRLFRYYGPNPRGYSVIYRGEGYVAVENPESDTLAELDVMARAAGYESGEGVVWFLGGHTYTISAEIALALDASGFDTGIVTQVLNPVHNGTIWSNHATAYGNARAGANLAVSTTNIEVGQDRQGTARSVWEAFLTFDTSVLVGDILSVALSVYGIDDLSLTDFTIEGRRRDTGGEAITTDDWIAGALIPLTPLMFQLSSVSWNVGAYNEFSTEAAAAALLNQSGFTKIMLCSSRQFAADDPTGAEMVRGMDVTSGSPAQIPKLVIQTVLP